MTTAVASIALIVAGVSATSSGAAGDRCPADRDVMTAMAAYAADQPTYERVSDAAVVAAKDYGYDPLSPEELAGIEAAAASPISTSPQGLITLDPDLPDDAVHVDLHISVQRTEDGRYLPAGGSFCARVVSGADTS